MAKSKPAKPAAKPKKPATVKEVKPGKSAKGAPARGGKATAEKPEKPAEKVNGSQRQVARGGAKTQAPETGTPNGAPATKVKMTPFLVRQKERLLQLRDSLLDAMAGVAKDNLRSRAEGSEASAFGMHQADAGSDAYDRDFALSLLSQEQDALYEIEEALKRIEQGTYGVCEMSGKSIAQVRLEALPFARYTVECQSQLEKQSKVSRTRVPVTSLFGLTDEEGGGEEEEESTPEAKEEKE